MLKEFLEGLITRAGKAVESLPGHTTPIYGQPGGWLAVNKHYELKQLPPVPPPSPARLHVFADVHSLAAFMRHHPAEYTPALSEILVSAREVKVCSMASWSRDTLTCELAYAPGFALLVGLLDKPMGQEALFDALSQLRRFGEGDTIPLALAGLQDLAVVTGGEITIQLDERGRVVFSGKTAKAEIRGKLPAIVQLEMPIYRGGQPFTFQVEIRSTIGKDNTLTFRLRLLELEELKAEAIEAEAASLDALLNEGQPEGAPGFLVGRGTLAYQDDE